MTVVGSAASAAANLSGSKVIVPVRVNTMPYSDGEWPLIGALAASSVFWRMSRMLLSPAKTPAEVVDLPLASVVVETAVCAAMSTKALLIESTRPFATALIFVSSRLTAIVTGSVKIAEAVTETPGSRSVKVFVADVMTCSAEVPFQRVTLAFCAVLIMALPDAIRTSFASDLSAAAPW